MIQRLRPMKPVRRLKALHWAVALALGAGAASPALAMRVGHSRVVSAPGAPLQAVVGLQELSPDEVASLNVSVADEAAWQRAGLKPPVPLASMVVRVEDGMDGTRKNLRVRSDRAPNGGAVDLLLNIGSSSGQRQVQVSILVPLRGTTADVTPASVGTPRRAAAARSVNVRSGDTLFGIAQRNAVPNANVYQMLVALWRANPRAFIQNNMNLVKAGEKLTIPDAATVRAVDPAEARRIFNEHAEAFARYRSRIGAAAGASPAVVKGQDGAAGTVGKAEEDAGVAAADQPQDRVRLSSAYPPGSPQAQAEAQADARVSNERALADAQGRVNQLQSNVDALNQALAEQNAAKTGNASGEAGTPGAAGTPGSAGA
ncbi:peptidoglycan-binding protein LysM, partial [Achromobacter sp. DMS1]